MRILFAAYPVSSLARSRPPRAQHRLHVSHPSIAQSATTVMPARCHHTDAKTSIRCRMPVAEGGSLCGSHQPSSVPCPKCGTSLPESSLPRHLTKPLCPVEKRHQAIITTPFYKHNINHALPPPLPRPPPATAPTPASIAALLARLPTPPPPPRVTRAHLLPEHPAIHAAWSNPSDHTLKMEPKHFSQIAALSALVLQHPPSAPVQIVEIAAGRAYTSLYLAHALTLRAHPLAVLAVDKGSNRYKADRTLRAWSADPARTLRRFRRIRIDLAHLSLENVPELTARDVRIVAKHACGAALDLAMTAATNFARATTAEVRLVLASCCRNRCAFHAFGEGGSVWTGWRLEDHHVHHICKAAQWPFDQSRREDVVALGSACQAIVDHARVQWLRSVGWDAFVTRYTDASPENACIVARWKRSNPENESLTMKQTL